MGIPAVLTAAMGFLRFTWVNRHGLRNITEFLKCEVRCRNIFKIAHVWWYLSLRSHHLGSVNQCQLKRSLTTGGCLQKEVREMESDTWSRDARAIGAGKVAFRPSYLLPASNIVKCTSEEECITQEEMRRVSCPYQLADPGTRVDFFVVCSFLLFT